MHVWKSERKWWRERGEIQGHGRKDVIRGWLCQREWPPHLLKLATWREMTNKKCIGMEERWPDVTPVSLNLLRETKGITFVELGWEWEYLKRREHVFMYLEWNSVKGTRGKFLAPEADGEKWMKNQSELGERINALKNLKNQQWKIFPSTLLTLA